MALRNTLLLAAIVIGVAVLTVMYVRRGLSDLQGQIDDIETVLSETLPPELTSGQHAWQGGGEQTLGGPGDPAAPSLPAAPEYYAPGDSDPAFVPDESLEDVPPLGSISAIGVPEGGEIGLDEDQHHIPEYSLSDEFGVATLSEPGVYESGVVQISVLPTGEDAAADTDEDELSDGTEAAEASGDDGEGDDDDTESPDSPPPSDEFDRLTLPQLKARLKATQPELRGIARMKRAQVLEQLRSATVEDVAE